MENHLDINSQFIPYNLAVKLKELMFDEPCLARYYVVTEWEKPTGEVRLQIISDCPNNHKTLFKAPLWGQAFDWFRKEHNLFAVIIPTIEMYWTFKTTTIVEAIVEVPPYKHVDANDYETYEEARQTCLEKLIELCMIN